MTTLKTYLCNGWKSFPNTNHTKYDISHKLQLNNILCGGKP